MLLSASLVSAEAVKGLESAFASSSPEQPLVG